MTADKEATHSTQMTSNSTSIRNNRRIIDSTLLLFKHRRLGTSRNRAMTAYRGGTVVRNDGKKYPSSMARHYVLRSLQLGG